MGWGAAVTNYLCFGFWMVVSDLLGILALGEASGKIEDWEKARLWPSEWRTGILGSWECTTDV